MAGRVGGPPPRGQGYPVLRPPRVPLPVLPQLSPPSPPGTQACRVPPHSRQELAEALTLAEGTGAAFVPPGSSPRRRRGRSMASPAGRVGPVGESVPVAKPLLPNRPLPERAHRSCPRQGGRGGRGEEGPGPLTCPPSLPHLSPAGGLGQVLGSVGNLGREPEAAGVQVLVPLVPWKSWHAAHGEPPLQGFPPPKTTSPGDAPAPRKSPRQEGGWCENCRGQRSWSRDGRLAPPHPQGCSNTSLLLGCTRAPL